MTMQCPHCHNEVTEESPLPPVICTHCKKPMKENYPNPFDKRFLPKWKLTSRICGLLTTIFTILYIPCLSMPFLNMGIFGSLSAIDLTKLAFDHKIASPERIFVCAGAIIGAIDILDGLFRGLRNLLSVNKVGAEKNTFFTDGLLDFLLSLAILICAQVVPDKFIIAADRGLYCMLLLSLCNFCVGIASRLVYRHLPDSLNAPMSQTQQEGTLASASEEVTLYDVVLIHVPKKDLSVRNFLRMSAKLEEGELEILCAAMDDPPVQIATAINEAEAQFMCEKYRDFNVTIEMRPHSAT